MPSSFPPRSTPPRSVPPRSIPPQSATPQKSVPPRSVPPLDALDDASARIENWMKSISGAAVAFSGGADSALMLDFARRALGRRLLAVTFDTGTLPAFERQRAADQARALGVRHRIVNLDMFQDRAFRENGPDRCYLCKRTLFLRLGEIARSEGLETLLEGTNASDMAQDRPGLRAVRELGARSPFLELGIAKPVIRALAQRAGLPCWNAPARACLASRIPPGTPVTRERVRRIEGLEWAILSLGFTDVRAREDASGATVRIEVPADQLDMASTSAMRGLVANAGERAGYRFVSLDLKGLRRPDGDEMDRQSRFKF